MKPGKQDRSKQRCQDLFWKVHKRAQSFVFRSYTMHELRNQHSAIRDFKIWYGKALVRRQIVKITSGDVMTAFPP